MYRILDRCEGFYLNDLFEECVLRKRVHDLVHGEPREFSVRLFPLDSKVTKTMIFAT
jgi:hypothetical protein